MKPALELRKQSGGPPKAAALTLAQRRQRHGLLAKIHIAKAQLGITDDYYEAILTRFKVVSAAKMTIRQLEDMLSLFRSVHGWRGRKSYRAKKTDDPGQIAALRARCLEEAQELENGSVRLAGLAKKICGVDDLAWCRETKKLERLLAVLRKIKDMEATK